MAKQYKTNSLGFPLTFNGPETVEDYDREAGKVGACLEDACENTIYRSTLPEFQDAFATALEQETGEKRQVNAAATEKARGRAKTDEAKAKVKDVLETVKVFVNRITAGMDEEAKKALAAKAQSIADGIKVDPSPSKRAAGLSKDLKAKAESLLTLPEDQLETKITTYLSRVEGYELERDEETKPTVESLGRLVGKYVDILYSEV